VWGILSLFPFFLFLLFLLFFSLSWRKGRRLLKGPFFVGGIDQKLPKNQKKCALWNFLEGWRNHREITTLSKTKNK